MTKASIKNKTKKKFFIKDRALVKFLLIHSKKQKINFSKIKISSFLDCSDFEESVYRYNSNSDIKFNDEKDNKIMKNNIFPSFHFSSLNEVNFHFNNLSETKINSRLFD